MHSKEAFSELCESSPFRLGLVVRLRLNASFGNMLQTNQSIEVLPGFLVEI